MAAEPEELIVETPRGPRDEYGHEWGIQVAHFVDREAAARIANDADSRVAFAGVRSILGPGCYRCKMIWGECHERPCPGDKPVEIDRLRSVGDSRLWGMDRKTRRATEHRDRKAALREGRQSNKAAAERDPYEMERDRAREEAKDEVKARIRNRNQAQALAREMELLARKRQRLVERSQESGKAGERGRRDLASFERRYGKQPPVTPATQEGAEILLGFAAFALLGGRAT